MNFIHRMNSHVNELHAIYTEYSHKIAADLDNLKNSTRVLRTDIVKYTEYCKQLEEDLNTCEMQEDDRKSDGTLQAQGDEVGE